MTRTALVAIGGNSLITDKTHPDIPHQWDAVRETCKHLAYMVENGWNLVITHGNGPQVGYILRRNELAAHEVHMTPLDLIVADTQGAIGYMLQQALCNELYSRGIGGSAVSIITQVVVQRDDPAFAQPSKPIGGFMDEAQALGFVEQGWQVVEDAGRGWRRVVASPRPQRIVEKGAIQSLIEAGSIVIAAGGGGIPVVENESGELRELQGVYAVIDKDLASGLLATELGVELLLIATGVEKVSLYFNTPQQQDLDWATPDELAGYIDEGHFAPGSMLPKAQAALDFVKSTGHHALITHPGRIEQALRGETGTWVGPKQVLA